MEKQIFATEITMHFNLRNNKIGKPSSIYMVIRNQGVQYKIPTHLKVMKEHWKNEKAMISSALSELDNKNNRIVNKKLLECKINYLSLLDEMGENPDKPFKEILSSNFDMRKKKIERETAIAAMTQAILNDNNLKESSKKQYYIIRDKFREFDKELCIDELNFNHANDFIKFLREIKTTDKITGEYSPLEDRVVKEYFSKFCTILGKIEQTHPNLDFSKITKLKKTIKKDNNVQEDCVALTKSEFDIISNFHFEDETLDKVRDIFCFQCHTGQRISDILALCGKNLKEKINEKNNLTIIQKKTGTKVEIPLLDDALKILEKYNYVLPSIHEKTINSKLKVIGEKCGFNDVITRGKKRGGQQYNNETEKYKLLTSHSARRTFVTLALLNGIEVPIIMKITGHKTMQAFESYIKLCNDETAEAFRNAMMGNAPQMEKESHIAMNPVHLEGLDSIDTLRQVCSMLGIDSYEWVDLNSYEALYRLICYREKEYELQFGIKFNELKWIFDQKITPKEKVEEVHKLINSHLNEKMEK